VVRVVLGWHEDQEQPLVELDASERRNPHVEEDAEKHSQRDLPQHVAHHNGQTCTDRAQGTVCPTPAPLQGTPASVPLPPPLCPSRGAREKKLKRGLAGGIAEKD